ncbi:hypothetical protein ENSA5_61540 [Enhygromyxa salina]|uniref:Uncharacterized protein n=1 Tax=Enhygromyxa salina TaxID=215803 RepID=A0A2S9XD77_9BACT|nr:nuclear transport factor 2 family protein [Enhygromyxa salina]PRP90720.1 hypothetical protein ENSA5_61540 [Enhygromyxa salina]
MPTPVHANPNANCLSRLPDSGRARALAATLVLGLSPLALSACNEAEAAGDEDTAVEERLDRLESKEELRSILLGFAAVVDNSDPSALMGLAPRIHPNFTMDVVDFDGGEFHFEGVEGLVEGFGPIMLSAQANLAASAISVELDGDNATASFKFINSVKPPPELGLPVDEKVLLLAANTVTFAREDGVWMLESLELIHSLAYPGVVAGIGG